MNWISAFMILGGIVLGCLALFDIMGYDVRGIVIAVAACVIVIAVLIEIVEKGYWR